MKHPPLITIIHDGVHNSVFESQVIAPLKKRLEAFPGRQGYLVSFEKRTDTQKAMEKALKAIGCSPIQLLICTRTLFLTQYSLKPMATQLRKILQHFDRYELLARGPIAGYLALNALNSAHCSTLTIQARGLLGHEYRYTHEQSPWYLRLLHAWRAHQFDTLERTVYSAKNCTIPFIIESVSSALSSYLTQEYHADPQRIIQAHIDIPPSVAPAQRMQARTRIRAHLALEEDAYVMCYSGSMKSWQCPDDTIALFAQTYATNPQARLMILTPDTHAFTHAMHTYAQIPASAYRIAHVPAAELLDYLSACDAGIVLRKAHIVNWVSRPTKALEYRAAGLAVLHNNTIGMLCSENQVRLHKKSHPHVDGSQ